MMQTFKPFTTIICLCFCISGIAQNTKKSGWFFFSHSQKISKKLDIKVDAQVRSVDKLKHVATLLLRGALSYNLNKLHSVALGYVYKPDWDYSSGRAKVQPENRIFEQYLLNTHAGKTEATTRFRLEQRFIKETTEYTFSQRARVFLSFQIPLAADVGFSKGLYTTLQDELFLTIHNKENVNNSSFDQNRAQVALGYRWSKKMDTGLSYMFWLQKEKGGYLPSNVFVLMITTDF